MKISVGLTKKLSKCIHLQEKFLKVRHTKMTCLDGLGAHLLSGTPSCVSKCCLCQFCFASSWLSGGWVCWRFFSVETIFSAASLWRHWSPAGCESWVPCLLSWQCHSALGFQILHTILPTCQLCENLELKIVVLYFKANLLRGKVTATQEPPATISQAPHA